MVTYVPGKAMRYRLHWRMTDGQVIMAIGIDAKYSNYGIDLLF